MKLSARDHPVAGFICRYREIGLIRYILVVIRLFKFLQFLIFFHNFQRFSFHKLV